MLDDSDTSSVNQTVVNIIVTLLLPIAYSVSQFSGSLYRKISILFAVCFTSFGCLIEC